MAHPNLEAVARRLPPRVRKLAIRALNPSVSCSLFLPRRVFEEVGGFDRLFFSHLEDLDFTWRIFSRGYRLEVWADTPVKHCFSNPARRTPARAAAGRDAVPSGRGGSGGDAGAETVRRSAGA